LAKGRHAILDLGCGTGVLAAALARKPDCLVVGVDPAVAMLALAKQRCGGASVSWALDDARTARLNRRFDPQTDPHPKVGPGVRIQLPPAASPQTLGPSM
jgi:predicted RNA methylase